MGNRNMANHVLLASFDNENKYILKSYFTDTILSHRDSLIVPLKFSQNQSVSVSVTNRSITTIPWMSDLSFVDVLNIMSVDSNNIRDLELIRRSPSDNLPKPIQINIGQSSELNMLPNDHLSIHLREKLIPSRTVVVRGEVISPGTYPLMNQKESLQSILNRAGGLLGTTSIHYVSVKRDTLQFGSRLGTLTLSPGDTVIAKPMIGTVKIEGEVHHPGNFEWTANSSAKDYLSFAGGLTAYGDKKHIIYLTPFGEAARIGHRSNVSILPGSTIRVSEKPLAEQNVKPDRFQQISSLVTSLVSIAILANTAK